jgi:energy-coupling factor transporter ATP-binding protein EcfA2
MVAEEKADEAQSRDESISEPEESTEPLPRGGDLSTQDALPITTASQTRLIIVAGEEGSGKTTLLNSVYEIFQQGSLESYVFAGSMTLPGFEERCHLGRIASGAATADTQRTLRKDELRMLHLCVASTQNRNERIDLLMSDLPGEIFEAARDSTDKARELDYLRRADRVSLLIDGAKAASKADRNEVLIGARALLRSCIDAGMLDTESLVDLVVSKWDLVQAGEDPDGTTQFLETALTSLVDQFRQRLRQIDIARVAARPLSGSGLQFGHGVGPVFSRWVLGRRRASRRLPSLEARNLREFERFAWRQDAS